MSEAVTIKFKDGKPEFKYGALRAAVADLVEASKGTDASKIDAKKVDPDDALECDVKSEMGGNWGASNRGEALSNLARNAVGAASTKGLSHKLKSDLHAHAANLFSKAADEHVKAGSKAEDYPARDAKSMADRHSKISAEMMK